MRSGIGTNRVIPAGGKFTVFRELRLRLMQAEARQSVFLNDNRDRIFFHSDDPNMQNARLIEDHDGYMPHGNFMWFSHSYYASAAYIKEHWSDFNGGSKSVGAWKDWYDRWRQDYPGALATGQLRGHAAQNIDDAWWEFFGDFPMPGDANQLLPTLLYQAMDGTRVNDFFTDGIITMYQDMAQLSENADTDGGSSQVNIPLYNPTCATPPITEADDLAAHPVAVVASTSQFYCNGAVCNGACLAYTTCHESYWQGHMVECGSSFYCGGQCIDGRCIMDQEHGAYLSDGVMRGPSGEYLDGISSSQPSYTVTQDINCGNHGCSGNNFNMDDEGYTRQDVTSDECKTMCNGHTDCGGFVYRPDPSTCYFRKDATCGLQDQRNEAPGRVCYAKNQ